MTIDYLKSSVLCCLGPIRFPTHTRRTHLFAAPKDCAIWLEVAEANDAILLEPACSGLRRHVPLTGTQAQALITLSKKQRDTARSLHSPV